LPPRATPPHAGFSGFRCAMIGTSAKNAEARFPCSFEIVKWAAQKINPVRAIERIISPQADRRVG